MTWLSEFRWVGGGVLAKKTGRIIVVDAALLKNFVHFLHYFLCVRLAPIPPARPLKIAFIPDRPRPWYLIWPTVRRAGLEIVDDPERADLVMHFHDATEGVVIAPSLARPVAQVNFKCQSISKSAVAAAFEDSFGYSLSVDSQTWRGYAVEKSEQNAAHDGAIVWCPRAPRPGKVYQRLIRNERHGEIVEDLRTTIVDGAPVCVFVKRRPLSSRFTNANTSVTLAQPHDLFSRNEIRQIGAFAAGMGLDWAGLDILRDGETGTLYIVDANKTDLGPPAGLAIKDKLRATNVIARAFRSYAEAAVLAPALA